MKLHLMTTLAEVEAQTYIIGMVQLFKSSTVWLLTHSEMIYVSESEFRNVLTLAGSQFHQAKS